MTLHSFLIVQSVQLLPINQVNSSKGIPKNQTRNERHKIHKEKGHLEKFGIYLSRGFLVTLFRKNSKVGSLIPRTEDYVNQNSQPLYESVYFFLLLLFFGKLLG